jgi:hypothetical protein
VLLDYTQLETAPYSGMLLSFWPGVALTPPAPTVIPDLFGPTPSKLTSSSYDDVITLLDAVTRTWVAYLTLADTFTLTDAPSRIVGLSKADVFTLVDALQKTARLSKADAYTLADAVAKRATHTLADVITLLDENTNSYTPGGTDMTFYRLLLGVG